MVSTTDLAIWFALVAGQAILCVSIIRRGLIRRLPWFSVYVFGATAETLILITAAFRESYATYYWVFYITGHFVAVLAVIALAEFGWQIFPSLDLPQKKKALFWLVVSLAAVVIFAFTWPIRFIEKRIELAGCLALAVACFFIAGYARYLRLYWSRLVGGVSVTLGILYFVNGVTKAIIGHYPSAFVLQVRQLRDFADVIAAVVWTVVVLSPWGEYKMTEDDLMKFQGIVGAAQANVRRFITGSSEITGGPE
jgi:hypothetical protein